MEDRSSSWEEQDNGYTKDDDSSSKHVDRSLCDNVPPEQGSFNGDDDEDDSVSELAIYV
jgi:hypothetical protein